MKDLTPRFLLKISRKTSAKMNAQSKKIKSVIAKPTDYLLLYLGAFHLFLALGFVAFSENKIPIDELYSMIGLSGLAGSYYLLTKSKVGTIVGAIAAAILALAIATGHSSEQLWFYPMLWLTITAIKLFIGEWGVLTKPYSDKQLFAHLNGMNVFYQLSLFVGLPLLAVASVFDGGFKDSPRIFPPGFIFIIFISTAVYLMLQMVASHQIRQGKRWAIHFKSILSGTLLAGLLALGLNGLPGLIFLSIPTVMAAIRFNNLRPKAKT